MNEYRVPIRRDVDDSANKREPDHIRGAKYANLLFGADYDKGDVVEMVYLDRVGHEFFERVENERSEVTDSALYRMFRHELSEGRAIVCVEDVGMLPDEFDPDPVRSPEATGQ